MVDGWCWVQADSPELREKLQGKLTLAKQAKAAYLKDKAQTATAAGLPAGFWLLLLLLLRKP